MRTDTQSICGCCVMPTNDSYKARKYLPQVELKAHTTVVSIASRTVLSQTFVNPSSTTDVEECQYTFPLYDGVSVVDFKCQVGSRVIKGRVKEKGKAKEEYKAALERGVTAGLLEQGPTSDVFMTSLGKIPAGEQVSISITYIGELKYDMGANGIRFTIPTRISPRYGPAGMYEEDITTSKGGTAIIVDVQMPEESLIETIRSPSHPIAVTLGRTSAGKLRSPNLSRASATLSLGTSTLDKDFVLEIIHQDNGKSKALLETHPTISGQRALMATFVHEGPVQQSKPEIILVADQSTSMRGSRTKTLVAALQVFLKSLPVAIKFNICYFGIYPSFLFAKSQEYNQKSLEYALRSLDGLDGKSGGTETLSAIRASIESRDTTQPLSIILVTDGDIWQQQVLFDYLNESVTRSQMALRVFALGIGSSVSSALVEGVARAGNGFAQSVGEGERLNEKVVRVLRSALTPDYGPLTLEIQYQKDDCEEDVFVMVERVSDSVRVLEIDENERPKVQLVKNPDVSTKTTVTRAKSIETPDADSQGRHDHLPAVPAPKLMQMPQNIPPLYPFSRTRIYVLMSPDAAQGMVKSIVLKGSSAENPFVLEVPIETLSEHSEMIHQLSAKQAITELEEGRGWLVQAKDEKGVLMKETYSARFQSMIKREAVRLGIEFQIAGKFTAFVATETAPRTPGQIIARATDIIEGANLSEPTMKAQSQYSGALQSVGSGPFSASALAQPMRFGGRAGGGSPGGSVPHMPVFSRTAAAGTSFFSAKPPATGGLFGGSMPDTTRNQSASRPFLKRKAAPSPAGRNPGAPVGEEMDAEAEKTDPLHKIIDLQTFEGYWNLDARLLEVVGLLAEHQAPRDTQPTMWATMLAITFLEGMMSGDREAWMMIVEKARGWLKDMEKGQDGSLQKWALARELVMGAN